MRKSPPSAAPMPGPFSNDRCLNCGYCPHCGQSRVKPWPVSPWPTYPNYPYWWYSPTGTTPVTITWSHNTSGLSL